MVNAKGLVSAQSVFAGFFFFFLREVRNESMKPHFFLWQSHLPHQNDILQDICPTFSAHWLTDLTTLGDGLSLHRTKFELSFEQFLGICCNGRGLGKQPRVVIPDTDFLVPILFQLKSQSRILKSFLQKPRIPYQDTWNLGFSVRQDLISVC